MKKILSLSLSLVFALAVAGLSGSASAADEVEDAYGAYSSKVAPIEQQLYAKQAELDAVYANPQPDTAKAQQLYREIAELKGQLFAAQAELRSQAGDAGAPYRGMHHRGEFSGSVAPNAGMHHPGEFSRDDYGYRGHRGGGWGHRGGGYMRHGGFHGGW